MEQSDGEAGSEGSEERHSHVILGPESVKHGDFRKQHFYAAGQNLLLPEFLNQFHQTSQLLISYFDHRL